ncbi:MAG: helix-turn-helix domain-containing protein [Clostridia bacterium]|nr:helix-turn-helix domain-containing protein [Clostridia bacterium]
MICIGQKVKELRKREGFTQEQLAEKLNVTPQTISRWECETAYPDITAIPILANIFNVSIDTLMGYDKTKTAEKVENIIRKAAQPYFWSDIEKCEKILTDALSEYPDNDMILRELLSLYECHMRTYQRMEYAKKAKSVARKLIAESNDVFALCSAKSDLASIYLMQDNYKDAKELIDSLPYMYPYLLNDRMRISSYNLKGEDRLKEAKDWKIIEYQELFIACMMEGEGYFETGNYASALRSFTECKDVIERFMKSDKISPEAYIIYGTQANHMACYLQIAGCLLKLGKKDECASAVNRAYDIVSLANGEDFIKDPEQFLQEYRRIYKEFGLEKYKPFI